jgi:hypothetical protein
MIVCCSGLQARESATGKSWCPACLTWLWPALAKRGLHHQRCLFCIAGAVCGSFFERSPPVCDGCYTCMHSIRWSRHEHGHPQAGVCSTCCRWLMQGSCPRAVPNVQVAHIPRCCVVCQHRGYLENICSPYACVPICMRHIFTGQVCPLHLGLCTMSMCACRSISVHAACWVVSVTSQLASWLCSAPVMLCSASIARWFVCKLACLLVRFSPPSCTWCFCFSRAAFATYTHDAMSATHKLCVNTLLYTAMAVLGYHMA